MVELDPVVIRLARQQPQLRRLNQDSLKDPRVIVHLGDAYAAVRDFKRRFDVVIADFLILIPCRWRGSTALGSMARSVSVFVPAG